MGGSGRGGGGGGRQRGRLEPNIPANNPDWQRHKLNSESFVTLCSVSRAVSGAEERSTFDHRNQVTGSLYARGDAVTWGSTVLLIHLLRFSDSCCEILLLLRELNNLCKFGRNGEKKNTGCLRGPAPAPDRTGARLIGKNGSASRRRFSLE